MARRNEPLRGRSIRTTDEQWQNATVAATFYNEDVSAAIRDFLVEYHQRYLRDLAKASKGKTEASTTA